MIQVEYIFSGVPGVVAGYPNDVTAGELLMSLNFIAQTCKEEGDKFIRRPMVRINNFPRWFFLNESQQLNYPVNVELLGYHLADLRCADSPDIDLDIID